MSMNNCPPSQHTDDLSPHSLACHHGCCSHTGKCFCAEWSQHRWLLCYSRFRDIWNPHCCTKPHHRILNTKYRHLDTNYRHLLWHSTDCSHSGTRHLHRTYLHRKSLQLHNICPQIACTMPQCRTLPSCKGLLLRIQTWSLMMPDFAWGSALALG